MKLRSPVRRCVVSLLIALIGVGALAMCFELRRRMPGAPVAALLFFVGVGILSAGIGWLLASVDHLETEHREVIRILVFIGLLGACLAAAWLMISSPTPRSQSPFRSRSDCIVSLILCSVLFFIPGLGIAVWADKSVGMLDPVSLRPLLILVGFAVVLYGFFRLQASCS